MQIGTDNHLHNGDLPPPALAEAMQEMLPEPFLPPVRPDQKIRIALIRPIWRTYIGATWRVGRLAIPTLISAEAIVLVAPALLVGAQLLSGLLTSEVAG